ncbi:MAG: LamG-like jellyroll fold domain-containing protein, partial [Saprospiraceae bacterium]
MDITVLPTEICSNGIDDDGDGLTDGEDPDCGCSQTVMLVARDNAQIMEVNLATEASGITTTSPYVSGNLNALAANADAGVMYYASGQIVYYWKPATNTHGILLDLAGQIAANESLSSGAAEYYNGFLYLGTEDGNPGVNPKVYRLKLTDNGLSPEGYLVDLNIPIATNTSWGDLVITTEGGDAIIYGMTSTGNSHFWRYNLMTAEFAEISTTLATEMQIGIDINGDMWAGSLCCGTIQKIDRTNATFYGDTLNFGGKIWDLTGPMNCPQAVEICDNGIDDDGDGSVDENCPTICDNNPNQTPVWAVDHDSSEPGHLRLWTFTDYDNPTTGSINYGELWYFNTTTGTMKSAGDAGDMEAMAVNKFTGQAYFLSNHNVTGGPTNTQALWTYDLKKAAVNSGNIILTLLGHVTKPTGYTMNSLAYDPATGNLFTADPRDANENNSTTPDKLYFIDLTQLNANPLAASTATLAGTISGNGASDDFVDGLAFDESGNLYAVDGTDKHLYRLDAATGAILAIEDSDIYGGVTANADAEALIWDIVNDRLMAIDNQNQTFLEITPGSDGSNVTHGSYAGVSGLPANADFEAAAMYDACPASRVAIGNLVFADYNRNGVYDNGEGIDNAEVQLFRTGNDPGTDEPLLTTTTSNNGFYLFENLEPGDYFIHLPASEFHAGSPMFELIPVPGAGGDIQQDDDVDENGLDPANLLTTGVSSGTITLTATSEPVDTGTETGAGNTMDNAFDSNGDMTVDFCFYSQEICYNGIDEDGDGLVDCDDPDCDGSISCSCILFQNGGFDGSLSPWQTSGSVSMTADGYNGTTGAAIDGNGASIYQTQTGISPGTIYTLTAFAKIENTPNYAAIGLRFFDGSMTQLSESLVEVTSAGFIQYSTIATAPANVVYIQAIALKQGAAGVLKIDEMCLSEFTPQTGDCILVVNPGFELGLTNWNTEGSTVQTTTDAHSGGLAAEIKEDGSTVSQQVAIQAGQTYELTTWAKVSGNPELAEIYMVWKDINSTNLTAKIIQPVNTTVTQWMPFTLKGKAPAGAVYAEIGAYKEGNSSKNLLVDDFCFSLTDTLGGTEYDLSCGCSDNLIPNGGYEESFNADFNYVLGGKPAAAIANDDDSTLPPWSAGLTSNYMFYIDDTGNTVNNPEGDYFVWLPNSGDCWISNTDFSNNLLLEDGETYIFCFYAASWAASLDNDGLPDGGTAVQNAGILDLEFTFTSGFQSVFTWSVPASESFNDLSWTKFEYTFTYDVQDPISNFVFTNMRDNVGMAIDAVTLSKVNCPKPAPCGNGGITYQRWGNLSGDKLARLLTSPDYPNNFDETGVLTSFQGPVNYDKNYGTRVFGYLLPAQTGTYYFNVTSDDNSRLYLSPDSTFIAKQLIAEVPGKTKKDEHDKYNSQTSGSINLNAGSKYYIELIHKEKKDDDHFQVYWKGPGIADWTIIPGTALEPICHEEICYNGLDDDNDGLTDCADPDCGTGLSQNYSVTDENCGSQQGAIDLQVDGTDMPFSYSWSDLPETARWTFEKTTDDVSGNNHHDNGTGGYPIFTHDAVDGRNSLYFDGSSYVRYSVDGGFMEVAFSKLSVSMWVKPTEYTGVHTLLDEGGSTNGYSLRINGDSLEFGVKNEDHLFIAGKHEFPKDGQWHHVAGVYDSGLLILYLDGVAGNSTTASFTTVKNHGSNGGFGATINGSAFGNSTDYFIGKMDDIRYYFERALTTAQITDLAKNDGSRSGLTAGVYNVTITSASGCSDTQQITVNSTGNFTDGGTIGGDETSCLTTYDPVSISTLTLPSPGAGPAEYRWQESTDDGATWSDIAGATGESYDPTPISAPTLYRRAARLVACSDWVYSNEISKSFTQNFDTPGSISGDESQCGAFDPAIINSTGAPTGGNGGATEYAWEKSTDGGATWNPIAGATAANFDPGTILVTTMYRRGARQANCENYLYTNAVVKTIVVNFDDPGAIVGDEDNCGSFDPGVIASVSQPSGGSGGTQEYQWQKSWDNVYWYDIAGANFETYDPSTITQTTYYRRGSRHQPCGSFLYSNTVTKMVAQNFSDGGYLSGDESVCGSFDPAPIVSEDPASGGAFGYQAYQWQQSPDGINWQNISGATSVTYDPGIISQTTLYRRQGRRLPCATWVNSNTITKTVLDYPLAQIQTFPAGTNGFICEKTSYSFGAADAGSGANYSWDFGPFATPQFANGTGPHSISFDVPQDSAFTAVNVRLTVSKNNCASTDATVFNIRPEIMVSSVITTDPTSCAAANGQISVSVITPPGASLEATVDGTNWTAPPFDFLGLGAGIYEIRLRYGANECEQSYGTVILNEPSNPTAALTLSATEGCTGTNFTMEATPTSGGTPSLSWDFGPDATPATATGAGPHTVTYATGGNKTISLTLLKDGCQGFADTTISVVENFTGGGTIEGDEDLCENATPSEIISTAAPSGGTGGTIAYQWEKHQDDGTGGWTTWTDIAGATAETLTPASISITTQYRRKARRSPCGSWQLSNIATKNYVGAPIATDDYFASACPGFMYFDNVSDNDANLFNAVYSVVTPPTNGTVDLDAFGEFIYTPNATFCGFDYFTYSVCNNGTGCCDIATASINLTDKEAPVLQNIPADVTVHCDDEIPLPPTVNAWENCQSVSLSIDEVTTLGMDSCSVYSYQLTRIWTSADYCGNSQSDQQVITIQDVTAPDIYRVYTLPNGKRMIAGVMENVTQRWKTVSFPIQFTQPPILLAQVVTNDDGAATTYRLRNVSTTQFQVRLQEEEGADGTHSEESIAWIAIEKGSNAAGLPFEAGSKLVSSSSTPIAFAQSYTTPGLIGNIQTFNENNPAALRMNTLTATGADVFCQEETSLDPETNHGLETVSYLVLGGTGDFATKSGEVFGETGQVTVNDTLLTVSLNHLYHNPVVVLGGLTTNDGQPATIRV